MAEGLATGARITSQERDELVALVREAITANTNWWILETADEKPDLIKRARDEAHRAHGAVIYTIYLLATPDSPS